ncbi:MAG: transcriptional regulator Crp [Pasteurellales bacterium]|nr:MAG: transcriptional regulator Crp [Pasteurellales bacterium]
MQNQNTNFKVVTPIPKSPYHLIPWFLEHCESKNYASHEVVFHEGDPADSLYYIIEGSVNVTVMNCEEKEVVLSSLSTNDFIGEMAFFLTNPKQSYRSASVITRMPCKIAKISYTNLRTLIDYNPEILMRIGAQMARRLSFISVHVSNLSFLDVTGKVTQTLLNIARKDDAMTHPDGMQISITRQELASMVGSSRETVGRVLKILEDEDVIQAQGKKIVVHMEKAEQFTYFRNEKR